MPSIIIEGPILKDIEKKRQLVAKLTEIVHEIYAIDKSHITVTIKGYSPDDVGVAGKLISDLRPKN